MPMHALSLCKLDMCINRIPVNEESEGASILGLGSPVCSLESLLLCESVQSVFQNLSCSAVGIFRCLAVLQLKNCYFGCHDIVNLSVSRVVMGFVESRPIVQVLIMYPYVLVSSNLCDHGQSITGTVPDITSVWKSS